MKLIAHLICYLTVGNKFDCIKTNYMKPQSNVLIKMMNFPSKHDSNVHAISVFLHMFICKCIECCRMLTQMVNGSTYGK